MPKTTENMPQSETTDRKAAQKVLRATRLLAEEVAAHLDANLTLVLWDGSKIPLGRDVTSGLSLHLRDRGVVPSILRRPSLDSLIRHYAHGRLDFEGGTLIDIGEALGDKSTRRRLRQIKKTRLLKLLAPLVFAKGSAPVRSRAFLGDAEGDIKTKRNEKDFIQFHYDVGNEFYKLFLDDTMVYTCAYFKEWDNSLAQAQTDKLDMICRKLRLLPGDRMLDIGCGWGGLILHAAKHYGVTALGVTLSQEQLALAKTRINEAGLADQVRVELTDYRDVEGQFDKISSIGMYEAIGVAAVPEYLSKIRSLLAPDGLFLNHGITRRAKKKKSRFTARAEQKALVNYIFPGGELDDIGNTVQQMEKQRFEVHDVEGWRGHYALTTRHWCERLTARREEAVALVGEETYRIWVAYLAGCSLAFTRGTAMLFQTLASKRKKGAPPLPPTRADLYR